MVKKDELLRFVLFTYIFLAYLLNIIMYVFFPLLCDVPKIGIDHQSISLGWG